MSYGYMSLVFCSTCFPTRYGRESLLQFMNICKEKPDNLPPLDVTGLEQSDTRRRKQPIIVLHSSNIFTGHRKMLECLVGSRLVLCFSILSDERSRFHVQRLLTFSDRDKTPLMIIDGCEKDKQKNMRKNERRKGSD